MIWQTPDHKQINYLPVVISAIYGINEDNEVIEDFGKAEVFLHFQKRLVWGGDLEAEN